jgi:protein phosphatase PTC1
VEHALSRFSTDNLSCMVVRFDSNAIRARKDDSSIGVEGDQATAKGGVSEADAIVSEAKKRDGDEPPADSEPATAAVTSTPETIPEETEAEAKAESKAAEAVNAKSDTPAEKS